MRASHVQHAETSVGGVEVDDVGALVRGRVGVVSQGLVVVGVAANEQMNAVGRGEPDAPERRRSGPQPAGAAQGGDEGGHFRFSRVFLRGPGVLPAVWAVALQVSCADPRVSCRNHLEIISKPSRN